MERMSVEKTKFYLFIYFVPPQFQQIQPINCRYMRRMRYVVFLTLCCMQKRRKRKKEINISGSKPKGTGILEQRNKGSVDMGGNNSFNSTHQFAADKHQGHGGAAPKQPHQRPLQLFAPGVFIKLVHRGVHTHAQQQPLHGVAKAAGAPAEYHHRIRTNHSHYPLNWIPSTTISTHFRSEHLPALRINLIGDRYDRLCLQIMCVYIYKERDRLEKKMIGWILADMHGRACAMKLGWVDGGPGPTPH